MHNVNKHFEKRIINSPLYILNEYFCMIKLLLQINILYKEEEKIIEERWRFKIMYIHKCQ